MKSLSRYLCLPVTFVFVVSSLHAEDSSPTAQSPQALTQYSIAAKARAQDYLQAFDILRKEKTSGKVQFLLKDGSTVTNIIDIHLMEQGSLLVFRFNSAQGIRFRIVALEDILQLEHQ
ncbi:MAG: hypothetical protein KGZ39_07930 [Simkania sp.]|nr:hypothetical protein [Simkania sp.]